jgi:acetyltransferase-like isoleucine patch superfamily enzyme
MTAMGVKDAARARYRGLVRASRVLRHPHRCWGYLKGCYYTWRFVDSYNVFPAIVFDEPLKLRIVKARKGRIEITGRLTVSAWKGGDTASRVFVGRGGRLTLGNDFHIGHDVLLIVSDGAALELGGADQASSGITCKSIVFATESITIGRDCIISWDTTITDSDHHSMPGVVGRLPVEIGDRVWVSRGAGILKGAVIGSDCVVGASALVLRGTYPSRSLLGGVPAKVLKSGDVGWSGV